MLPLSSIVEVRYCPYGDGDGGVECHADADLLVMLVVPMLMLMVPRDQ